MLGVYVKNQAELIALGIGGVLALLFLWLSLRANRRRRLVDDIPTSKTTGVFIGLIEVKGTAEAERPVRSYLAEIPCVYYKWEVEEHWSRTTTESYTDSDGNRRTRTKRESGWKTVASGGEDILFYLQDDCGVIRVNQQGAKIQPDRVFSEYCHRGDPLYYAKGPAASIMDSDHRRRFTEHAIPLHARLYVMGRACERQDVVAAEIAYHESAPMFLISTKSEEQISSSFKLQLWLFGILGLIAIVAAWIIKDCQLDRDIEAMIPAYIGVGAGFAGVWLLGWMWMAYNSMIGLRNRVNQAWANVDVQLKRRHDLIPNIVNIVKGLKDYERTVQTELAELRSQAQANRPGEAGPDPHACAGKLIALKEAYPELKANDAFLRLQNQLVETEQRIALARTYFNEIAAFYNGRLQIVPDTFISKLARLKPQKYITAKDFERAVVEVHLSE
ncbi:MAG: LemA family protein [Phycisphaerae bacterium]|nr:LemA family protein [Phycisphaerae bacterium]